MNPVSFHNQYMDYLKAQARARRSATVPGGDRKRKVKTGPIPGVPWRDLDRRSGLESHLPLVILLGFGLLAGIQLALVYWP